MIKLAKVIYLINIVCKSIFNGYSMDNKNDNCKKSVKYNMPENIETEEVIDYSVNCYYINNEKQQNNNDSIINYQTYCGNVCNTEKNVENDDEIIEFSNFNDITPNKDYKDNNQNNNKYDKKDFEQDPDFKSELNGDDDIVEYNAQDDPDLMNDNNYLNNNINNNNNINLNNNNNNESSDDYSSYDDDDDSRSFAENVGSQIYGGDGILLGSSDGGESINPDEMTYEQLLELQEKIGFVNKGFSESMIGVS